MFDKISSSYFLLPISLFIIFGCHSPQNQRDQVREAYLSFQFTGEKDLMKSLFDPSMVVAESGETQIDSAAILRRKPLIKAQLEHWQKLQQQAEKNNTTNFESQLIEQQVFHQLLQAIPEILSLQELLRLSKEQSLSMEAYIAQHIRQADRSVQEEEFNSYCQSKGINCLSLNSDQIENIKSSIAQIKEQKLIYSYLETAPGVKKAVRLLFKKPQGNPIGGGEHPIVFGDPEASQFIQFYGSFRCPYCSKNLSYLLKKVEKRSDLKVLFRFQAVSGQSAEKALAEASFCIHEQSLEAFKSFYLSASTDTQPYKESQMLEWAEKTGIDQDRFNRCRLSRVYKDYVQYHFDYARYAGVIFSPTMIFEGAILVGGDQLSRIDGLIPQPKAKGFFQRVYDWIRSIFKK